MSHVCDRKIRYPDRVAALVALANCRHKDGSRRPKIEQRAYRCPRCRGWHLTSQPSRAARIGAPDAP